MFYLQKTISVFVLFCFALFFVFFCVGVAGGVGRHVDWNWGSQCLNN